MNFIVKYFKELNAEKVIYLIVFLVLIAYIGGKIRSYFSSAKKKRLLNDKTVDYTDVKDTSEITNLANRLYYFFNEKNPILRYFSEGELIDMLLQSRYYTDDELILLAQLYSATNDINTLRERVLDFPVSWYNDDEKENFLSRLNRLGII